MTVVFFMYVLAAWVSRTNIVSLVHFPNILIGQRQLL